ncbi:MAG: hypothetical protein IJG38_13900, partial [Thermoguttaceae bacterium]|nr:hypothetical protein [Thermoguttaceae bacterium]
LGVFVRLTANCVIPFANANFITAFHLFAFGETRARRPRTGLIRGFRYKKALTAKAVKLDSEGGVHPGKVFGFVVLEYTLLDLAALKKLSVASKLAPFLGKVFSS